MKVKELLNILKNSDPEMEVVMFAKGDWFPTLDIQEWTENDKTFLEIGGGWNEIENENEN
jgi:hypothetical protein